jgi:hypothetical protein
MTSGVVRDRPPLPDCLDGDMTAADIAAALDRLSFHKTDLRVVTIDRDARDFLVSAVRDRCKAKVDA